MTGTRLVFESYDLDEITQAITVRHPSGGYPVWIPVIGIRGWFADTQPPAFFESLRAVCDRFMDSFLHDVEWQKGVSSKGRTRKRSRNLSLLPSCDASDWDIDLCGPGNEKLQAFPCSFRTAGVTDATGRVDASVRIAIPIDRYLIEASLVDELVKLVCDIPGLQFGYAGLCGAGTPDHQSLWRSPEFFILLNYLGIDPSEDSALDVPQTHHRGYNHSAQWITLLGPTALGRLGGAQNVLAGARDLELTAFQLDNCVVLRASPVPLVGFRTRPQSYQKVDGLIRPNRGKHYFAGHGFEMHGEEYFDSRSDSSADLWMKRFEDSSHWLTPLRLCDSIEIALTRSGGPIVTARTR